MIYKIINSAGNKLQITVLNTILILLYITTFSSCMTTYESWNIPDSVNQSNASDIKRIELNDGTLIDCKDKILKFENAGDSGKYILISAGNYLQTYWSENRIPLKDIYKIYTEKSEVNSTMTAILVTGLVIVTAFIVFLFALGSSIHQL